MRSPRTSDDNTLIDMVRDGCIGDNNVVWTPFGARRLTYADYAASGRSLAFIEDFIQREVLPMYGNTHTETSATALQTTRFREDARKIIAREVGAGDDCAVLFAGSGTTAAVTKIITALGLRLPESLDERYSLSRSIPKHERPVVFIGPYEHHSNELPWRETIADVVVIPPTKQGLVDLDQLQIQLRAYRDRPLRIGSFSAASNVTGIMSDTDKIADILHRHGALAFFDYAAGGPHMKIHMGRNKDAIFISPHKFPGGVGTPGVLVVRKTLMRTRVPTVPGGGTVDFVTPWFQAYTEDIAHREEGGTPAIVESIRAGLAFQLKGAMSTDAMVARERAILSRAFAAWRSERSIEILGNPDAPRVPIVSFIVRSPSGQIVHHNFIVALLNDLFGIQIRGGCSCAGPYGHDLLNVNKDTSYALYYVVRDHKQVGIKPGWCRVTFKYFFSDEIVKYIIRAVVLVARYGWALMPLYTFTPENGLWTNRRKPEKSALSLDELEYGSDGVLRWPSRQHQVPLEAIHEYMREGEALLRRAVSGAYPVRRDECGSIATDFDRVLWFDLPKQSVKGYDEEQARRRGVGGGWVGGRERFPHGRDNSWDSSSKASPVSSTKTLYEINPSEHSHSSHSHSHHASPTRGTMALPKAFPGPHSHSTPHYMTHSQVSAQVHTHLLPQTLPKVPPIPDDSPKQKRFGLFRPRSRTNLRAAAAA
ncbi:uncharacterized protein EHS24_009409 [Apiotrichum porosum]|uniref:Aminotransferase class V domain-containing protein n=1 Tax=Apiotrichum porosum TaxID=105984 RepID=A0A427XLQ7_9TREE|nr:uncharacterized protein EHS24_009409 [Apiotrichum porosum]RSH79753.1 hypothetical protein EHS24_009409 [Apiotrichum porosum]